MPGLLVTGGAGYLGSALVRAAGAGTLATYFSRPAELPAEWVQLDVRDAGAVDALFEAVRPDRVVHTAYRQSGPDLAATTVDGAGHVAKAAASVGARLVHISSDVVFDGEKGTPYVEADEPSPVTEYGAAKAVGELVVEAACPGAAIVRTSLLYGGTEPSPHERLALDAARGEADVTFFTDEIRSPAVVGDVAAALLELAASDHAGPLHVAGADAVSRYEFARLVVGAAGGTDSALRSGLSAGSPIPRPRNCALDSSLAGTLVTTRLRGVRELFTRL